MKRLVRILKVFDFIWSVPLAFFLFIMAGIFLQEYFGWGVASYDPAIIQAAFLTVLLTVFFSGAALAGMAVNWNKLFTRYVDEEYNSHDKTKDEKLDETLFPWQRQLVLLFVYFGYLAVMLILFIVLV
jgi:hypothetical protein